MTLISNDTVLFEDTYNIQFLSTIDDDKVFQCEVVIMTTPLTIADENITLDFTGKFYQGYIMALLKNVYICGYSYVHSYWVGVYPNKVIILALYETTD